MSEKPDKDYKQEFNQTITATINGKTTDISRKEVVVVEGKEVDVTRKTYLVGNPS